MIQSSSYRISRTPRLLVGLLFGLGGWLCGVGACGADETRAASETVDRLLREAWTAREIVPAEPSDDAEFCRRVWLDLAGVAPPLWQIRTFLVDKRPNKREILIDELLESSRYATHMANRWNEVLLPANALNNQVGNQAGGEAELHRWLQKQFHSNTPYDHVVGGFLTAGGEGDSGPAIFYTSRETAPVKVAAATSRIFLGLQLECAECHDHPFSKWTQEDFWQFAAFFSQLRVSDSQMRGVSFIEDRRGEELTLPETERVMAPRYPGVATAPEADPTDFRRRQLTIWLASRDNPYFARAAVNRAWSHLFGRGIVDPVDAMDDDNPASHPELLAFLADYFVQTRFDLKTLYRTLARTRAYGLSSSYQSGKRPSADSFAVMSVKTLSANQYFDSLRQNVFLRSQVSSVTPASADGVTRTQFLSRMRVVGSPPTEYPHGVVQALAMMNGPEMLTATGPQPSGLVGSLDAPFFSQEERIKTIFLACLSRPPSVKETEMFLEHLRSVESDSERQQRYSDIVWVLLNTAECFVCP